MSFHVFSFTVHVLFFPHSNIISAKRSVYTLELYIFFHVIVSHVPHCPPITHSVHMSSFTLHPTTFMKPCHQDSLTKEGMMEQHTHFYFLYIFQQRLQQFLNQPSQRDLLAQINFLSTILSTICQNVTSKRERKCTLPPHEPPWFLAITLMLYFEVSDLRQAEILSVL